MANYLSNETMLELLKEAQQKQIELLNAGLSAHLDANLHENTFPSDGGTHISFDMYVFDGNMLDKTYNFSATDSERQNRALFATLVADINAKA